MNQNITVKQIECTEVKAKSCAAGGWDYDDSIYLIT